MNFSHFSIFSFLQCPNWQNSGKQKTGANMSCMKLTMMWLSMNKTDKKRQREREPHAIIETETKIAFYSAVMNTLRKLWFFVVAVFSPTLFVYSFVSVCFVFRGNGKMCVLSVIRCIRSLHFSIHSIWLLFLFCCSSLSLFFIYSNTANCI